MEHYGELDGEIVYQYATHFAQVKQSLSSDQQTQLAALRLQILGDHNFPTGAYLYSNAIEMPEIANTDFLFGIGTPTDTSAVVTPAATATTGTSSETPSESQSCSANGSENAVYDLNSGVLSLNHIKAGELWYQVELQDTGNLVFVIKNAAAIGVSQQVTACYDMTARSLSIPRVIVGTQTYSAVLKHGGDWQFRIEAAELLDQPANTTVKPADTTSQSFTLTSSAVVEGKLLNEYQCEPKMNGVEASIPLAWSNVPAGTGSLAMTMHHYPNPNDTSHLNSYLLLWNIDPSVTEISYGAADDGPWYMGANKDGAVVSYTSPCSPVAGTHEYTVTLYALSETPSSLPKQSSVAVTYEVLTQAISTVKVLGKATLSFSVTR
jgi:hypothetical protein